MGIISYIKCDQKIISQAKIDKLYQQKVVQKPSDLVLVMKMVNPVMTIFWKALLELFFPSK